MCAGDHLPSPGWVQWDHHGIRGDRGREDLYDDWSNGQLPIERNHPQGHFTGDCVQHAVCLRKGLGIVLLAYM